MLKRMLCLFFVLMLLPLWPALAEENSGEILTLEELRAWVDGYKARALATQPLNDPAAAESLSEDGYMFVYEFATLYMDGPEMTEDSEIQALVVYSSDEAGLRGVRVDDSTELVLAAYYTENPDLIGSRDEALLYAVNLMPEGVYIGRLHRDGQRIQVIDYAVYEQPSTGGDGYMDAGIMYTVQDNNVTAIRAYGLNSRFGAQDVDAALAEARQLGDEASYSKVYTSYVGSELEPFNSEDLLFAGMDFANLTPEEAIEALGEPQEDVWQEDAGGYMRRMQFASCDVTFVYDMAREKGHVVNMMIDTDLLEGPRSVRVGDTLSSVLNRFLNGEGAYDNGREPLYGSEESGDYGLLEYRTDASFALYYGTHSEEGTPVTMYLNFDQQYLLEILLVVNE